MRVVKADTLMGLFIQLEHGKNEELWLHFLLAFLFGGMISGECSICFFSGDKFSFLYGHQSL